MARSKREETGNRGERIAASYLADQGWELLATNWECALGELDIVACRDEEVAGVCREHLAFVEVKCRSSPSGPAPEYQVNHRKRRKIGQLAEIFLEQRDGPDCTGQFDIVAVRLGDGEPEVQHYPNAFDAEGRLNPAI